jgi:hypothetical protein
MNTVGFTFKKAKGVKESFCFEMGLEDFPAIFSSSFTLHPRQRNRRAALGQNRIQRHTLRVCRVFLPVLGAILPTNVAGFQTSQAVSGSPAPAGHRNFASAAGLRMVASNSRRVAATDDPCIVSMQVSFPPCHLAQRTSPTEHHLLVTPPASSLLMENPTDRSESGPAKNPDSLYDVCTKVMPRSLPFIPNHHIR